MKKKIIALSIVLGLNILQANDLELVGKNVVKNTSEIKKLLIEINYLKSLLKIKHTVSDYPNISVDNTSTISHDNSKKFVKITAHFLNVRSKPNNKSRISEVVKKNEVFEVVEIYSEKSKNKYWVNIGSGYVNKNFVEEVY
ncbi:MAG: hypothetical protein CL624_13260 [Arcobacter sp.]|nr:hypothetical protein [Arcobacter sp.]|tara:strand:- start:14672 stop:15094 length:423 start_codon:yes stop_codon:yes gene_type:complete